LQLFVLLVGCVIFTIVPWMSRERGLSDDSKSWSPHKLMTESPFTFDVSIIKSPKQSQNESTILDGQILQMLKDTDDAIQPKNSSRDSRKRQNSTNLNQRSKAGSTSKDLKGKKNLSKSKNPLQARGQLGGYVMTTFESISNRINRSGPPESLENIHISKFAPVSKPDLHNTPDQKSKLSNPQLHSETIGSFGKPTERERMMQSRNGNGNNIGTLKKSAISSAFNTKYDLINHKDSQLGSDESPAKVHKNHKETGLLESLITHDSNHTHNYQQAYEGSSADTSASNNVNQAGEIQEFQLLGHRQQSNTKVPCISLQTLNKPFSSSTSITLPKNCHKTSAKEKVPVKLHKVLGNSSGMNSLDNSPSDSKQELKLAAPVSNPHDKTQGEQLKKQVSRDKIPTAVKLIRGDRPASSEKETKSAGLTKKVSSKQGLEPVQPNSKRGIISQQSNRHFPSIQEVLLSPQGVKD
jgi:hypothetical protein